MQVFVSHKEIETFKRQWPCSGIPELSGITFEFDSRGNLCDIIALDWQDGTYTDSSEFDGPALLALSQDAQHNRFNIAVPCWQR